MTHANVQELNEIDFDPAAGTGAVLIDFWAPWCGPCRMMAPVLEEVAAAFDGRLKVAKVNVDENASLANRFSVQAIPLLILLKDGAEVARFVGLQPKADLLESIRRALAGPGKEDLP